jgi:ribosomal protein S18 acetylase RimI-like enzyme
MNATHHLARRVEEASLNGWPALRDVFFDGWLIRLADGYTRRTNSVNLLFPGMLPLDRKIRYCEAVYAAQGLPTIFCISSSADPALGRLLDERGYNPAEDESCVLLMDFAETPPQSVPGAVLEEGLPGELWLASLAQLHGQNDHARRTHRRILENLAVPAVFAAAPLDDGSPAALAYGAVHDGIVCVNSVVTHPDFRRQGQARKAVAAVLSWAQELRGATGACLSVVAENAPARALYESMGFTREMYRYHYRRRSAPT